MKLLPDTHLLLWALTSSGAGRRLPSGAAVLMEDAGNEVFFSAASVWEVAIKQSAGKTDFQVEPHVFRRALLDAGYLELAISSAHGAAVVTLPHLHKDPFDRLLIAQATVEGLVLLTVDETLAHYPGPVRRV